MTEPEPKDREPGPAKEEQSQQSTGQLFDQTQAQADLEAALANLRELFGIDGAKKMAPKLKKKKCASPRPIRIAQSIVRETIDRLKAMTDCRMSGDDSGLANVWEEVCVQVQGEQSIFWGVYLATIDALLAPAVQAMDPVVRHALWLKTEGGQDWKFDHDDEDDVGPPTFNTDDIIEYLNERVLTAAGNFENSAIRRHRER